ncbi:MAG: hypothetical protein GX640_23635 [Fibrobacter sp.]|nr:hypothetical protein [Fibrobacter sp.]
MNKFKVGRFHFYFMLILSNLLILLCDPSPVEHRQDGCPPYTHKEDVTQGDPATLPDGYFIYTVNTIPGLFKSKIHPYVQAIIPNTQADRPQSPSISDNGKWVCYVDGSRYRICLVDINGYNKTIVPLTNTASGYPTVAGFYRNSPMGTEIFYLASSTVLRSIKVDLSGEKPAFSTDRIIVDLEDKFVFDPDFYLQISVVKDQVFGEICPLINGEIVSRTGYLTIPDGGRGIGGPADVYKWRDDALLTTRGCGHTQSHDGSLCLENPGFNVGRHPCTPHSHNGFYISPFRRVTDPPIDLFTEHIDKYSISINWCPIEFQNLTQWDADFWGWDFSNRNDYVIGRQMGNLNKSCAWMIDWPKSIWYRLTPVEKNINIVQPSAFFFQNSVFDIYNNQAITDTSEKPVPYDLSTDLYNPRYKVIKPNGGEVFTVGEQCTVWISAAKEANANINISYDRGISWNQLPGLDHSVNPMRDSLIIFTIPDSVFDGEMMVSTVSNQCLIQIFDYGNSSYRDKSDSTFSIVSRK